MRRLFAVTAFALLLSCNRGPEQRLREASAEVEAAFAAREAVLQDAISRREKLNQIVAQLSAAEDGGTLPSRDELTVVTAPLTVPPFTPPALPEEKSGESDEAKQLRAEIAQKQALIIKVDVQLAELNKLGAMLHDVTFALNAHDAGR